MIAACGAWPWIVLALGILAALVALCWIGTGGKS